MTEYLFYYFMAIMAYTVISFGNVLMKKAHDQGLFLKEISFPFYRNFLIWLFGFIVLNSSGVFIALATKAIPPNKVSAFAAWGIVVLLLFSKFILNDHLRFMDIFDSILVITGIIFLASSNRDYKGLNISTRDIIIISLIPVLLFLIGIFIKHKKVKSIFYSLCGGFGSALLIIFTALLVSQYGYDVKNYIYSAYLYLYIIESIFVFFAFQLALKNASVVLTGTVSASATMAYPIMVMLMCNQSFFISDIIALVILIIGVYRLLNKREEIKKK